MVLNYFSTVILEKLEPALKLSAFVPIKIMRSMIEENRRSVYMHISEVNARSSAPHSTH